MNGCALTLTAIMLWLGSQGLKINSKEAFVKFSEKVSKGNSYTGTTIYLTEDIDLDGVSFKPIGSAYGDESSFMGTFDGQGHKISNLNITTSESLVGLFGNIVSGSVNNIVIDSTCIIKSTNETDIFIGGIVGAIAGIENPAFLTNCINMAKISALGGSSSSGVGGLIGIIVTYGEKIYVKNCANFGDINVNVPSTTIGGIMGFGIGSFNKLEISNCLNSGDIFYDEGGNNESIVGGIAGRLVSGLLKNCVNIGNIDLESDETQNFGEICGYWSTSDATNCFCKSGFYPVFNKLVDEFTYFNDNFILENSSELLVDKLNSYSEQYDLNEWFFNKGEHKVNFAVEKDDMSISISFASKLIISPRITDKNYHFEGWYTDREFRNQAYKIVSKNEDIYGKYDNCIDSHTITFITNREEQLGPIHAKFGEIVSLPHGSSQGKEVIGVWLNTLNETVSWQFTMPAKSVTLHAKWVNVSLNSAEELKEFAKHVNSGIAFSNITIFLENDIDMSGIEMEPIGVSGNSFEGTFDGKGHAINNLYINSTNSHVGLFGYSSRGMVVRNIIIDQNCTVIGFFSPYGQLRDRIDVVTGGVIGYCMPKEGQCILENTLNAGTVKFGSSNVDNALYVGGLVGYFGSHLLNSVLRNSLFLGTIDFVGSFKSGGIGGIIGGLVGSTSYTPSNIENCMNSGKIIFEGTTSSDFGIGGVIGYFSENSIAQNCLNIGSFEINETSKSAFFGDVIGIISNAVMKNCYWYGTGEDGCGYTHSASIEESKSFGNDFNLKDKVTVSNIYNGYSLIGALNAHTFGNNELSKWAGNGNKKMITFVFNKINNFIANTMVTILPSFVSDNMTDFFGWYTDKELTNLFTEREVSSDITLYGEWGTRTDFIAIFMDNDKITEFHLKPGAVIQTSEVKVTRKGYTLVGWLDEYGWLVSGEYTMPRRNITFTPLWLKTQLQSPNDFKEFSESVNKGANCLGKTITLKDDIDMSGITGFEPIGTNEHPFMGTFEGQGYRVSNLKINTTAQYSGLFGNSFDASIQNIILDGESSIEIRFPLGYSCSGGILGYCGAENKNCSVINVVNQAEIINIGQSKSNTVNFGGIMGLCKGFYETCIIANCANFGSVVHRGVTSASWIGGVLGRCSSWGRDYPCKIWNNFNNGKIIYSGNTNVNKLGVGGLIGFCDRHNRLYGCVSAGNIELNNKKITYAGSIFGKKESTSETRENIWFQNLDYGDFDNGNIALDDDLKLENGTDVVEVLKILGSARSFAQGRYKRANYTATWIVNKNNSNVSIKINKRIIARYNSSIILLPTLIESIDYYFTGWKRGGKKISTEEIYGNAVYSAVWKRYKLARVIKIFFISTATILAFLLICFVSFTYVNGYKKRLHNKRKLKNLIYPKVPEGVEIFSSLNNIDGFYPKGYKRPTMEEALKNAGLDENQIRHISGVCYKNAYELKNQGKLSDEITTDDAAAIAMYTFDFGTIDIKSNPYYLINNALNNKSEAGLNKIKDILYLVISALRKLPIVHGIHFYRGIRVDVSEEEANNNGSSSSSSSNTFGYKEDSIITWNALSSTSPSLSVTKNFLAKGSSTGKASGTLFIIEDGWGYDIQPYSLFPTESEILLEPERQFQVVSVISAELTIVKLKMLRTFIILPEVYGEHKLKVSPIYFIKERANKYGQRRYAKRKSKKANRGARAEEDTSSRTGILRQMRNRGRMIRGGRRRTEDDGSDDDYYDSDDDYYDSDDDRKEESDYDSKKEGNEDEFELDDYSGPSGVKSSTKNASTGSQGNALNRSTITDKLL